MLAPISLLQGLVVLLVVELVLAVVALAHGRLAAVDTVRATSSSRSPLSNYSYTGILDQKIQFLLLRYLMCSLFYFLYKSVFGIRLIFL